MIIYNNYLNELSNYKYIIHSRFDQYYADYHEKYTGEKIWIPEGEDYFGICDRHAVFPSKYSEQYFGISNLFKKKAGSNLIEEVTPESVFLENLKYHGLGKKIKRTKRIQFTSAVGKDNTRWRVASYRVYLSNGLLMKYPDEFMDSIKNSMNKNGWFYFFYHPILCLNYLYLRLRIEIGATLKALRSDS